VSEGPNFEAPHEPVPDRYAGADPAATPKPGSADGPPGAESFWWRQFHDPELERLETAAASGNLDLKAAYLRIVESRLQVQQARAQGLPSLNATAQYTREQLGLAGILKAHGLGTTTTTSASTQALIGSLEEPVNLYQLGFDASWELDLFGRVRRSVEAAKAQSTEALESKNDLLVTLQAEVAQTYLQLRAGQVLRQITHDLINDQRDVVELTRARQEHGLAGEADVESAQGQLSNLESQLPQYDQSVAVARHALAVLTGRQPETLDAEFGESGDLPTLPADIDVGVPSTLARRRPDIRSAEAALHAATAEVGVSVAALYPDVSLTGTYGLRNIGTRYLFDWSSKFYTATPAISLPIFRGGSLQATVRLSRAQAEEAALDYRKTVLSALQEVEDGLTGLHEDGMRAAALRNSVDADQRALDINLNAYRRGLVSYLTVLTVQLQVVQARQQLAQSLLTQSTDVVKIYKALGGGWETDDPAGAPAGREGAAVTGAPLEREGAAVAGAGAPAGREGAGGTR
jgi:NodT family efflux transporter outer membrane factor (OMF) lipoprotein